MAVNVVLKSVWDDRGIKDAQKAIGSFNQGFDRVFKGVAVAAAAAAAAVAVFAKQSITAASSLEESTNAVNVAFGDAAEGILKIGETSAKSFGLARTEFNQAAVRFSAFAERVVGQGGDVAGFIENITQRAADFASVFNIEVSEALRVFQSGLSGEAEPLKRFGINLLDTEVKAYALRAGIIGVGESLTETQKVQARYGLLLESTNKVQGDFANTSDSLANQQRILQATFTDLQAEIGTALLPVVSALVKQIADFLLPKLEEFGKWIKSPQGEKAVKDFGTAIANVLTAAFNFAEWIIANFDEIKDYAIAIGIAAVAFRTFTGAVQLATGALALFKTVAAAGVFFGIAAGLAAIAGGMYLVYQNTKQVTDEVEAQRVKILENENAFVTAATNGASAYKGLLPNIRYNTEETRNLTGQVFSAAYHLQELDNIKLQNLRREVANSAGELNRFRNIAAGITGKTTPTLPELPPLPKGSGPSAFEQTQKIIKDAQKKLKQASEQYNKAVGNARKTYDRAIVEANKTYTEGVTEAETQRDKSLADALSDHTKNLATIQRDFARKQADIIQQSIDRLRDAYASAVRANVADLFETEEVGKSIDNLINNLRDRLTASRNLVANTALLASRGFSQTFLEQVVGAGLETGNELAKAILEATPETQRELQSLFGALEQESETGMDSVAKTIYDKTGLATSELKKLFAQTQADLVEALKQAQIDYSAAQAEIQQSFTDALAQAQKNRDDAFGRANESLNDALSSAKDQYLETLSDIREAFEEQIKALEGKLGGLAGTVKNFRALLASLMGGKLPTNLEGLLAGAAGGLTSGTNLLTGQEVEVVQGLNVSAKAVNGATGLLIDSATDVGNTLAYLDARIANAFKYATNIGDTNAAAAASARATAAEFIAQRQALANAGEAAVGTVININVKTDTTQSLAMVGRTLGNTITKYVTTGGEVLVSSK